MPSPEDLRELDGRAVPAGRRARWTAPFLCLMAVVCVETVVRGLNPPRSPDTGRLICAIAKEMDPSLFPRDPQFSDPETGPIRAYIPLYRRMLIGLTRVTGDPWRAFLATFPIKLALILTGLWLVLRETTGNVWLAALLAVAASCVRAGSGGGNPWGLSFAMAPLARHLFLGVALLAFVPMVRTWPRGTARSAVGSLLIVGLLANVHPPTALGWFLIMSGLILAGEGGVGRRLRWVALGGALALVAALPTAAATLRLVGVGSGARTSAVPFAASFAWMVSAYKLPFAMSPPRFWYLFQDRSWQWVMLAAYLAGMGLWAAGYARRGRREGVSRAGWTWLLLLNAPMAFILTSMAAVDLVLIAVVFGVLRWRRREVCRMERLAGVLLTSTVMVVWCGTFALLLAWRYGEIERLGVAIINFTRVGKMVFVPLWLFAGLWVAERASRRTVLPLLAVFAGFFYPRAWHSTTAYFGLVGLGVAATEVYWRWEKMPRWARVAGNTVLVFALALGVASYNATAMARPTRLLLAAAAAGVGALIMAGLRFRGGVRAGCVAAAAAAAIMVISGRHGTVGVEVSRAREYVVDRVVVRGARAAELEVQRWARRATAVDALFYLPEDLDGDPETWSCAANLFRAFSRRSVVHTYDAALAPPEWLRIPGKYRYRPQDYFEEVFKANDPALLGRVARAMGADYVVLRRRFPRIEGERVVYENGWYRVIALAWPGRAGGAR